MCGRYSLFAEETAYLSERVQRIVRERFGVEINPEEELTPGQALPTYTKDGLRLAQWGLSLPGKRGLLINLRAETAMEKPFFRRSLSKEGRCLFPAAAYYEWMEERGHRQRCRFQPVMGGMFYMAGLLLPAERAGEWPRCVILTTKANESVQPCHHRMPLILPQHLCRAYLFEPARLEELLASTPPPLQMAIVQGRTALLS